MQANSSCDRCFTGITRQSHVESTYLSSHLSSQADEDEEEGEEEEESKGKHGRKEAFRLGTPLRCWVHESESMIKMLILED